MSQLRASSSASSMTPAWKTRQRQCLGHEGSGNTRQRQCRTSWASESQQKYLDQLRSRTAQSISLPVLLAPGLATARRDHAEVPTARSLGSALISLHGPPPAP